MSPHCHHYYCPAVAACAGLKHHPDPAAADSAGSYGESVAIAEIAADAAAAAAQYDGCR